MKNKRKRTTREKQAQSQKRRRNILIAFLCVVLFCFTFIVTDAYVIRHSRRMAEKTQSVQIDDSGNETNAVADFTALGVPSVALDNSVMLTSVLNDAKASKYSAIAFDLKRDDGTIGYTSALTTVDTFGGISTPATQLHDSLKTISAKNIKPVARICCLKDNVVPKKSSEMAVMKNGKVYVDDKGNTYLNPESDEAVKYLREIVSESYNLGVRVFILSSTKLPDGAGKNKGDGFKNLVNKIRGDAGNDAVFLEAVDVKINGWNIADGEYNDAGIKDEVKKLPELKSNQIYVVKTEKDINNISKKLKKYNVKAFIIYED